MAKISSKLISVQGGAIGHWCPGCKQMHAIYNAWKFDNNLESPTFTPSVMIRYNGPDADQMRDDKRRAPSSCCHYNLTVGEIHFHGDSTHELKGQIVPLPDLPEGLDE